MLRRSKLVSQPLGAFFVVALRWIILFEHDSVRVFNDMMVGQASAMIESLEAGGVN